MTKTSTDASTSAQGSPTHASSDADVNWDDFESEFSEWGRKLDELRTRANPSNLELLRELDQLHSDLKDQAAALRAQTEKLQEDSDIITPEMRKRMAEAKESAMETAKDTSDRVSKGAQEMQEGFTRAWKELRSAFDAAATHFKDEPDTRDQRPKPAPDPGASGVSDDRS